MQFTIVNYDRKLSIKSALGSNVRNLFTSTIYEFWKYAGVFALGSPFLSSLMFVGKAGMKHMKGASLR